ncbi:Carcinoembryonic antigen-related cell adhesion molecule 1 [Labeo rohita]|uniref:Carcinoembryonic antigen-related cell adhesion molecule 1 n=1 Tax=Labeo rohita TaxID=84645 RepID=A0ABQ8LJ01_LABRO|nr:Carcinoembryonic antigen-related cell adhesion molecule 1 [Labeo rohita]
MPWEEGHTRTRHLYGERLNKMTQDGEYRETKHLNEMKNVSVKEGEPVSLHTGLIEIKGYDLILWTFKNHLIAKLNKTTNQFSLFSAEGKFEGRLQREHQSGSLIISDSRTTDSVYYLNMSSSTYTLQRAISVIVKDSGLSPGVIAGICVAVVVLVILIAFCCWIKKKRGCKKESHSV